MSWKEFILKALEISLPYLIGLHQKQPRYMQREPKEEG